MRGHTDSVSRGGGRAVPRDPGWMVGMDALQQRGAARRGAGCIVGGIGKQHGAVQCCAELG